jgi:hypothetical protein
MFEIRKEVMQVFRDKNLGPALNRLSAHLRAQLPDLVSDFSPEELRAFCDRGAVRAKQYGITTEYNVYRFLAAILFFGENFDANPKLEWTKDFLFDPLVDQDHKSRLLELRIAIDRGRGV